MKLKMKFALKKKYLRLLLINVHIMKKLIKKHTIASVKKIIIFFITINVNIFPKKYKIVNN